MQDDSVRAGISRRAGEAFRADMLAAPQMTLRGGYAEDSYEQVPAPDPELDRLTDAYLEAYTFWGLGYLDPASWRHYLPYLIDYAFRHMDDPMMAVEGAEQEAVIAAFLEELAFSTDSANRDFAMQVLEEWWIPDALFRRGSKG